MPVMRRALIARLMRWLDLLVGIVGPRSLLLAVLVVLPLLRE